MDWVPSWDGGIPPDGAIGLSALLNWQYVLILQMAAELEELMGGHLRSQEYRAQSLQISQAATLKFWDDTRGLFTDDISHQHFSEHTQCLALLSGLLNPSIKEKITAGLVSAPDLTRTTVYFTHYLFETYREIGRTDLLLDRMSLWFDLKKMGFKTPIEQPEPSRSDCHAWSSHPLYHYYTSILGIRPASLAFKTVRIKPQLGPLSTAQGKLVHPNGVIDVDFRKEQGNLHGHISLPDGISGVLQVDGETKELTPGAQEF